jgi:hypothetical protein
VRPEQGFEGRAARELHRFEGGPVAQDVANEHRILLLKPLEDVGEVVFERTGQAIRQPDVVADQATAVCHELCQGAHAGALRGEWGEFVAVCEDELDLECGIGGVVFRLARGKRFAVSGHGERIDGKEHEESIVAQRGHDGPLIAFQAHRDGWAIEARAPGLDPGIDHFRAVFKAQQLPSFSTGGL